ncbi:MAG: hypothetical protein ACRDBM_03390 [Sporomusa sp.]
METNRNVPKQTGNDSAPDNMMDEARFYIIEDATELEQLLSDTHPADAGKYIRTQRWHQGAPLPAINTPGVDNSYSETAAELARRLDAIEAAIKSIERLLTSQIPHSGGESVQADKQQASFWETVAGKQLIERLLRMTEPLE